MSTTECYDDTQVDTLLKGFAALFCVRLLLHHHRILIHAVRSIFDRAAWLEMGQMLCSQILGSYFLLLPIRDEAGVALGMCLPQ